METIKKRKIILKLSDNEVEQICNKAAMGGMLPEELLEKFVGDLTNGIHTSGSDERRYANAWYERSGFVYLSEKNLLRYLIEMEEIEKFLDYYNSKYETEDNIRLSEENIKRGGLIFRNGKYYSWSEIMLDENMPAYETFDDWVRSEQEYIEQEQEYLKGIEEELEQVWEGFLKWKDETETVLKMDEEVEKIKAWKLHCASLKNGISEEIPEWQMIAMDIANSGFKATDTLIMNMLEFSSGEQKRYTLKDIAELKKINLDFSDNSEKKRCFEQIIKECQEQELEKLREEPHFLKREIIEEQLQIFSAD